MRKMWTFMIVIFLLSVSNASATPSIKEDAAQLLSVFKELRFTVESNPNYAIYRDSLVKANIEYRRFIDKYPGSALQYKAENVINAYKEAHEIWRRAVFERSSSVKLESPYGQNLVRKYPSLMNVKLHEDIRAKDNVVTGHWWWYSEIIPELWQIAAKQEALLQAEIEKQQ